MAFHDLSTYEARSALPPRGKEYWHRLAANHHLGIRVTATNGASWVCRVRAENGGYRSGTLGRATILGPQGNPSNALSFKVAVQKAKEFRVSEHKSGRAASPYSLWYDGQLTICPVGDVTTVGHALHHYIEWRRLSAASSTFKSDLSMINYHLVPRISTITLSNFNGSHFYELCRDFLETPPKKGSAQPGPRRTIESLSQEELRKRKKSLNGLVSILRTAFTLAWDRGELNDDRPIRCLRHLPCHQQPRPNYLTRPQCQQLLSKCPDALRNLVAAGLYTGCRVGELTRLKVREVADQGFGIYISRSKNHRTRFVFLPMEGMAFFLNLCVGKGPDDYVLPHADGTCWHKRYAPMFRRVVQEAGLPKGISFHTLRHSYASQLVEDGAPLSIVARQLGHASTMMVDKVYGHLSPSWSEVTVDRHFAPLLSNQELSPEVSDQLEQLRRDPTGLARTDRNRGWLSPVSKSDTMREMGQNDSWPRSNHTLFQGPILKMIAPTRKNAP